MLIYHPRVTLLCKFNLKNIIDVPTRITGDSSSLIDLIITSVPFKISGHGACNPGISDHHLIYATVNLRRVSKLKLVRDFKRVEIKALQLEFALAPCFICGIFDDIDDCVWTWDALYKFIIDEHIPLERLKLDPIVCPGCPRP